MKTSTVRKSFVEPEHTLALSHTYRNEVYYHFILTVEQAIYAEHIKDICIQEIHPFFEELSSEFIDSDMIERLLEQSMQKLNHNLSLFAEQYNPESPIHIHGGLLISYRGTIVASLIGQSSLIVCREDKAIYSMANSDSTKTNIDHFTDYISGSIHRWDSVVLLWQDHTLLFHQKELDEIAHIINENDEDMLIVLESMITQRIESDSIGFLSLVRHISSTVHIPGLEKGNKIWDTLSNNSMNLLSPFGKRSIEFMRKHKYIISISILWIGLLRAIINVISGAIEQQSDAPTLVNEEWVTEVITIEEIKKNIAYFQNLDPSSDTKGQTYKDIIQKLDYLASKNRRPEDVKQLKKIVQNKYYEWFKIAYINQLDDPTGTSEFQSIYPFNDYELKILWEPINLYYERWFMIGGTKWAILKGISKDIKWTAVGYSLETNMKKCSQDLSRSGLYCFDSMNEVYRITAGSVQPVQWNENVSLPTDIQDIGVFGKSNLYLLINPTSNGWTDVIKRLRNELGSFTVFKDSIGYTTDASGSGWIMGYSSMNIDGTFLVRSSTDKKLYQLWRETNPNKLNRRLVPMQWWDTSMTTYSANVKIISTPSSPYVYLFDKDNQTFTVYKSAPLKTNSAYTNSYSLSYVMRYTFDLTDKIIDVSVPEAGADKPMIYVMTKKWAYQANLGQTISAFTSLNH